MSYASVPCVSDFKTPFDKPIPDDSGIIAEVERRMENLNADTLQDAIGNRGSENKTFQLLASAVGGKGDWDKQKLSALYMSIYDDMYALVEQEMKERS